MKPYDLPVGDEVTGRFLLTKGEIHPEWCDLVVRIRADYDGAVDLEFPGSSGIPLASLVPASSSAHRAVDRAASVHTVVIVSIVAVDGVAVDIQGRVIPLPRAPIPIPSSIAVEDEFAEIAMRQRRGLRNSADVVRWLSSEFLIQDWGLAVLWAGRGQRSYDTGFRLIGREHFIDVATSEIGGLSARNLQRRRRNDSVSGTIFMHEDLLEFFDRTLKAASRSTVPADLDATVQPQNRPSVLTMLEATSRSGTWIEHWRKYNEEEARILEESQEALPSLEYLNCYVIDDVGEDGEAIWLHNLDPSAILLPWQKELDRNRINVEPGCGAGGAVNADGSVIGRVTRCDAGTRRIRIAWPQDFEPSSCGSLVASSRLEKSKIDKREHALRKLNWMQAANPRLAIFLDGEAHRVRVSQRRQRVTREAVRLFGPNGPNREQRDALKVALATPDLALIQGPPGTGKTRVIQALVTSLNRGLPIGEMRGNVLVTSYQHEAVDNAIEGFKFAGLPVDRRGGSGGRDSGTAQNRSWAKRTARHVEERAARRETPAARAEREVRDLLTSWLRSGRTEDERQHFLEEVLERARPFLSPERIVEIQDAIGRRPIVQRMNAVVVDPADRADIKAALDAIPEDEAGLRERGARSARRLKMKLGAYLDDLPAALCAPLNELVVNRGEAVCGDLATRVSAWKCDLSAALFVESPLPTDPQVDTSGDADSCFLGALADLEVARASGTDAIACALREFANGLTLGSDETLRQAIGRYSPVTATSCGQADSRNLGMDECTTFPVVVVDEAARANPLDLLIALVKGRRVVLVGDHRQLPHVLEPKIERRLEEIGYEGLSEIYKESLFEYLWGVLERQEDYDRIPRRVRLREQFRMHPVIGDFVSQQFYDSELLHRVAPGDRPNRTGCFGNKPVAWIGVPREKGGEERFGSSWMRMPEAKRLRQELKRILNNLIPENSDSDGPLVGVITFYAAQARLIEGLLGEERDGLPENWRRRVKVGTVDAFQGREYDVVLLSAVRSNDQQEVRQRLGFTALPNRLCVALSRARCVMAVFGDPECVAGRRENGKPWSNALAAFFDLCTSEVGHVE